MNNSDIHARLRAPDKKFRQAEQQLKLKDPSNADYITTNLEFRERYKALTEQVNRSVRVAQDHGHHIGDLEI